MRRSAALVTAIGLAILLPVGSLAVFANLGPYRFRSSTWGRSMAFYYVRRMVLTSRSTEGQDQRDRR